MFCNIIRYNLLIGLVNNLYIMLNNSFGSVPKNRRFVCLFHLIWFIRLSVILLKIIGCFGWFGCKISDEVGWFL